MIKWMLVGKALTIHITLKDVSGNVIDLHGANCSLSMVFVTTD